MAPPPTEPPEDLLDAYTLNGTVTLERLFIDESNGGKGTHYTYDRADVDAYVAAADAELTGRRRGRKRMPNGRSWIIAALRSLPVLGSAVAVFGAVEPWAEALLLAAGVASVVTYEYNSLSYDHPALSTGLVTELVVGQARGERLGLDLALSLSSFDHDGLGRSVSQSPQRWPLAGLVRAPLSKIFVPSATFHAAPTVIFIYPSRILSRDPEG